MSRLMRQHYTHCGRLLYNDSPVYTEQDEEEEDEDANEVASVDEFESPSQPAQTQRRRSPPLSGTPTTHRRYHQCMPDLETLFEEASPQIETDDSDLWKVGVNQQDKARSPGNGRR